MLNRVILLVLVLTLAMSCSLDAYYDPHAGRFISRDPVGDGINWYAYAYNNPLAFIDPSGLRPVNAVEQAALLHTFGESTGNYLIDLIDVQFDPSFVEREIGGEVRNNFQVTLSTEYKTDGGSGTDLEWLSTFIHEATHIWQRNSGLHRGGKGGVDYVYTNSQLLSNDLKKEEHAAAVSDWFFVDYGVKNGFIGLASSNPRSKVQVTHATAWARLFKSMGHETPKKKFNLYADHWKSGDYLRSHVNFFYGNVINEVRTAPLFGQNFPNPF